MYGLDDTGWELFHLLLADGREPFSDIAEEVRLSPTGYQSDMTEACSVGIVAVTRE